MMRLFRLSAVVVAAAWLGGCAAPPALQVASVAVDGVALMATGKGSTDHVLSAVADADCRLSNVVRGHAFCDPWKNEADEAEEGMDPAAPGGTVAMTAFAAGLPSAAEIQRLAAIAPAAGMGVIFQQSPGMNIAEVTGAPVASTPVGHLDASGTLRVHLRDGRGIESKTALFVVPDYTREPGRFTGIVMGAHFYAPEDIIR